MKRPEQILQKAVFDHLIPLMVYQKYSQFIAFQIKNETGVAGTKGAILGGIAKGMGTMAGVSDICILFPPKESQEVDFKNPIETPDGVIFPTKFVSGSPKAVFIEFKASDGKRTPETLLSTPQKEFKARIENMGFEYHIVAAPNTKVAVDMVYDILRNNGVAT